MASREMLTATEELSMPGALKHHAEVGLLDLELSFERSTRNFKLLPLTFNATDYPGSQLIPCVTKIVMPINV